MAAARSREWDAGVSTSAPPLTTNVLAEIDSSAPYTSYRFRLGRNPAAVVNDVVRKVDLNEYKRKQAAPGLRITPLAFGIGRRIPIVQKYVS